VDNVSVENAVLFCDKTSELTGKDIRLPTEAEWEYAARGRTTLISEDNDTVPETWFFLARRVTPSRHEMSMRGINTIVRDTVIPVGLKKPNPFGLYDIYGNVCERVQDTYRRT